MGKSAKRFGKSALAERLAQRPVLPRRMSVAAWLALSLVLAAVPPLAAAGPAAQNQNQAQTQKKNKKDADSDSAFSGVNIPDAQAIDVLVSQMLGAWQIGDADMMHKYYADDVIVVSGAWEPPLIGWPNYLRAYQAQRARTEAGRLDRSNSYTKVVGDAAWVTYQWQFTGAVDGAPARVFGHTTLELEKRAGTWLITLDHTSTVPMPAPSSSSRGASQSPPSASARP
jgi:uncharacterized protein (TIGR02246 family)